MKKNMTLVLLALAVMLPLGAETRTLTVDQAVELGLANNFNIKVQESQVGTAARAREDRWNVFIPDVSASATLSRSNTATSVSGSAVVGAGTVAGDGSYDSVYIQSYSYDMEPWTLVGSVSAQLALTPALKNGITALELNYNNALLSLESLENSTEQSIRKNFYQLLLLKEQIGLLEKNIATMENRLVDMEEMYNYGYITELDLLNTEAALASMGPTLTSIKNGYELALMSFRMDLGLELDAKLDLDGEIEVAAGALNANALVESYLADTITVRQMEVTRQMLENAKSANFNQSRMPTLILSGSWSPYQAGLFDADAWFDDDYTGDNGSISLTVSMPVDNWLPHSGTDNSLKEAQDAIDELAYQRELAVLGSEMQIRSLVMNLNTSMENLAVKEAAVELNQKSYDLSEESYNSGGLTLSDLETAEDDLLAAESDLLSEKYTYISNLLDLEAALNRDLD